MNDAREIFELSEGDQALLAEPEIRPETAAARLELERATARLDGFLAGRAEATRLARSGPNADLAG